MLQLDAIYKAAHVLKEVIRRTDLIYAPQINPESTAVSYTHLTLPTKLEV